LELFEPTAIAETILNYAREKQKEPTQKEVQKIASVALYFTGGHPKCMVPIMEEGLNTLIKDVIRKEKKYYETNMLPVIEDIKTHIKPLYETFETLSVVRKISRTLLEEFIENNFIKGFNSKFDVEARLLGTFIFQRKEHFLVDAITRRVLVIHLRHSNPALFEKNCLAAINCYSRKLEDPQSLEPAILAVELLYLHLQSHCINNYSKPDAVRYFKEKVYQILQTVEQERHKNALDIFEEIKALLEKDQELKLNLQYLIDVDMEPFIKIVNNKIEDLKS
jgi:hypothetical protein